MIHTKPVDVLIEPVIPAITLHDRARACHAVARHTNKPSRVLLCAVHAHITAILDRCGPRATCGGCHAPVWSVRGLKGRELTVDPAGGRHDRGCADALGPMRIRIETALRREYDDPVAAYTELIRAETALFLQALGSQALCSACDQPVYWLQHLTGERVPYSPAGVDHAEDCPKRESREK